MGDLRTKQLPAYQVTDPCTARPGSCLVMPAVVCRPQYLARTLLSQLFAKRENFATRSMTSPALSRHPQVLLHGALTQGLLFMIRIAPRFLQGSLVPTLHGGQRKHVLHVGPHVIVDG